MNISVFCCRIRTHIFLMCGKKTDRRNLRTRARANIIPRTAITSEKKITATNTNRIVSGIRRTAIKRWLSLLWKQTILRVSLYARSLFYTSVFAGSQEILPELSGRGLATSNNTEWTCTEKQNAAQHISQWSQSQSETQTVECRAVRSKQTAKETFGIFG